MKTVIWLGSFFLFGVLLASAFAINPAIGFFLYGLILIHVGLTFAWQIFFTKTNQLMVEGKFQHSIDRYEKALPYGKISSWLFIPNYPIILYNIATSYARWGRFEESLQWTEKINRNKLTKVIAQGYYGLIAFDLLHLNRDLDRAEELLEKSISLGQMPYPFLGLCYSNVLKNDFEKAKDYLDQYLNHPNRNKEFFKEGRVRLKVDKAYFTLMENFYLGLYYQAIGDLKTAKDHFFVPAMSPYDMFMKREATRLYNAL